jgi:hypothetical protein
MPGSLRRFARRFRRLTWRQRWALLWATTSLLLARAALLLLPFRIVFRLADGGKGRPRRHRDGAPSEKSGRADDSGRRHRREEEDVRRRIWAVNAAGNRLFPDTPCLTQAVVVHRLLRRWGWPSELRIGVRKDGRGKFGAHAWIESEGEVLIGGDALSEGFVPMPPVSGGKGRRDKGGLAGGDRRDER